MTMVMCPGGFTDDQQRRLQRELADKITNYASTDDIRLLLILGAQVNGTVVYGLMPLHYACHTNNLAAAKLLLNKGAKVNAVDEIGCSALHLCAEHGYYRMIQLLLQHMKSIDVYENPTITATMTDKGRYPSRENVDEPLRLAIKNGHYDCARLLLEHGADANAVYFDGPEITHVSCLDVNFIQLLLEHGANPNVFDRKGLTPIMRACRLKANGIPAIRIFLRHGADVNMLASDRQDNRTALHYGILSGSADLVRFLIQSGARVNMTKDYDKPSALDIAVLKDDPQLLQVLLDAGADPNAVHTYIGSALQLACCSELTNQYAIVRQLLESGADANLCHEFPDGSRLKSPFVEYFRSRETLDMAVLGLMLSYGGRVFMQSPIHDCRGQIRNILRLASTREHPELLSCLLSLAEGIDEYTVNRLPLPEDIKSEIIHKTRNPGKLQHICRQYFRTTLRPFKPTTVSSFPIPVHMKDFLLGLTSC